LACCKVACDLQKRVRGGVASLRDFGLRDLSTRCFQLLTQHTFQSKQSITQAQVEAIIPIYSKAMANNFQIAPDATQRRYSSELILTDDQQRAYTNASPIRDASNRQAPLSFHGEELVSSDGRMYYANHTTRTTAWRRPSSEIGGDYANNQAGLPAAWEALVESDGRTYYANHESRTTTFDRPEGPTGELPAGWEMLRTPPGVAYLADHNTHTATWEDPRRGFVNEHAR
jgi:hypothetical protein